MVLNPTLSGRAPLLLGNRKSPKQPPRQPCVRDAPKPNDERSDSAEVPISAHASATDFHTRRPTKPKTKLSNAALAPEIAHASKTACRSQRPYAERCLRCRAHGWDRIGQNRRATAALRGETSWALIPRLDVYTPHRSSGFCAKGPTTEATKVTALKSAAPAHGA